MKSSISILVFFFCFITVYSQKDIKVISSTAQSLIFEYTPVYNDSSNISSNNTNYKKVGIIFGSVLRKDLFGSPNIQHRLIKVGVPAETGNTVQVISSTYKEVNGKILPISKPVKFSKNSPIVYTESDLYRKSTFPSELADFGEYGVARGMKVQNIVLNPVAFNAQQNKIRLYTKIVVQVNFSQSKQVTSQVKDNYLQGAVLNFNAAKNWIVKSTPIKKIAIFSSVLSSGTWYRFTAPDEGFYKITKTMLASFGIDASTVDPRTIKIYNNGGSILPENNDTPRPQDLVENAIYVQGESDGKFDDSDYVLFYGRGINYWNFDTSAHTYYRNRSPYSFDNYYWITSGGSPGKRMQNKPSLNVPNPKIQTTTYAFTSFEQDLVNIGNTGREFYGDQFTQSIQSRDYANLLEGIQYTVPILYKYRVVNASTETIPFQIEESGNVILTKSITGYSGDYIFGVADSGSMFYSGALSGNRSVLKFIFNAASSATVAYLDYFEIYYLRDLKYYSGQFNFFSDTSGGTFEYRLSNFPSSDIHVYDVSDFSNVKMISNPVLQSGGEYRFQSSEQEGVASRYLVFEGENYKTPLNPIAFKNQNIHGSTQPAKYIIITNSNFVAQANRLKTYREQNARMPISSVVVDCDEIFNEFSCGMKDPTAIRDFLRYAYVNWNITPEYVLLLGDGDFDYRNIEGYNKNFIIPYETEESLYEIDSYCTDDYYVAVDGNDMITDLSIGRLTVQTLEQATDVVDKIIAYEANTNKGEWQNLITLVADDGYTSTGFEGSYHVDESEAVSNFYIPKSFDQSKLYLSAYPTVQTSEGRRKPGVNQAIIDGINAGTLVINFIGHGSSSLWTHEQVLVQSVTIPQFVNQDYFFLTAITCEFGYYDIANNNCGAEDMLLKKNSGAIGTFCAVRPVYADENAELNQALYNNIFFTPRDTENLPIPIGKAIFLTKQALSIENDQKYNLLGDPLIRLDMPQYSGSIDSINGIVPNFNLQIKALSNVSIKGSVIKDNTLWNSYNGQGILTMYDSQRSLPLPEFGPDYYITVQGGIIFKGKVSVVNGKFQTNFVVPKDISYVNQNGKIVFDYFNSSGDGLAFNNNIIVGGTDSSLVDDKKGPEIEIHFDNINSDFGYLVNPNSVLIAKLSDKTGLNITGIGVGHKMEGILDNDQNNPIDFTNFFTGDLDANGKSGTINYQFNNLSMGEHNILVKAWDVFNNPSSVSTDFKVVDGNSLVLDYVVNYPNPFSSSTYFTFQHNYTGGIYVKIRIYTVAGRLIKVIEPNQLITDRFVKIQWDGRDKDGSIISNGTYLYKLIVESSDGSSRQTALGKLAVIR